MSVELKIKSKTLAAEAVFIREAENKAKTYFRRLKEKHFPYLDVVDQYNNLYLHRMNVVRKAARSTHLARAIIKGVRYRTIEAKCYTPPSKDDIADLLGRYGKPEMRNMPKQERIAYVNLWLHEGES